MKRLAAELIALLGDWYGGRYAATSQGDIQAKRADLRDKAQALYQAALDRR